MKRPILTRILCMALVLLVLSALPTGTVQPVLGANADELEVDSVSIVSVTPNDYVAGSAMTFTVTVEYSLQSEDRAEVLLGVNVKRENSYEITDSAVIERGSGSVTLSAEVTTSAEWETRIYANISPLEHEDTWMPLTTDIYSFSAETGTETAFPEYGFTLAGSDWTYTASLHCPELKASYPVNLPESAENSCEYSWGFYFTDGVREYSVSTAHWKYGEPETATLYDMQTTLWRREESSYRSISDPSLAVEGTTLVWTFTMPEDFDPSGMLVTKLEIRILGDVTILNMQDPESEDAPAEEAEYTLPTATQYVPYEEAIPASQPGSSFALASGSLPKGLRLGPEGKISGFPEELGVFPFTVMETYGSGSAERKCTLSVYSRIYADVEENNVPGYGFVETAGDDGRVQDQSVSSSSELTDQVMHLEGAFTEFRDLYLDARKLERDVEYKAEEGSTKLTILAETIGEAGGGTHTLAAEFETADSSLTGRSRVYTVQNYTVAGIASREVRVTVDGEPVIWTDAEPYIDTNNRTMTPFRAVGDALGLTADWDGTAREVSFTDGAKTIFFPIDSPEARTGTGETVRMDTSAVIVNGRSYAPIRTLAEFFGWDVAWDAGNRTVRIVKAGELPQIPEAKGLATPSDLLQEAPAERRSPVLWIGAGVLVLAVLLAGGFVMKRRRER